MLQAVTQRLWKRTTVLAVVAGVAVGIVPAGAIALSGSFNHTFALWNHGYDGSHVYMSSTDGAGRSGSVAGNNCSYAGGSCIRTAWHTDIASHIHNDYNNGALYCYNAG
jgi:hypothetical protein